MDNKNNKIMTMVFIVSILILVVSTTYAFFAPQQGGSTSTNTTVTSNTTDLLTFSINRDISFTVTQADFEENGQNKSGDATATATLTPNNKTGAATMNYYLYLNLQNNPTVYSEANTNQDPELMLQIFDGNNQLVTLTGLGTQKTIKGVTGYDITGVSGLKTLLDNHAISASNNTATIENWRIVITLINLDVNQNDNTGKTISAEIIISKEEVDLGLTGTIYRYNTRVAFNNHPIEDEIITAWCYEDNGIPNCTQPYATQAICESWGDTCSQNNITVGVGNYVTNVNDIINILDVYCPIGGDYQTCTNDRYYLTEQECLDNVDTSIYTCTPGKVLLGSPFYLKHTVVQNVITNTEVCIHNISNEFCFEQNYWDTDGETTKAKLKADIESSLGITLQDNRCRSDEDTASCYISEYKCSANISGKVKCELVHYFVCYVDTDGISQCPY